MGSKEILRQQIDGWCASRQTAIYTSCLGERREKLLREIKFATVKENPELTCRLVAKLIELDDIITLTHNADSITEHGCRGFAN